MRRHNIDLSKASSQQTSQKLIIDSQIPIFGINVKELWFYRELLYFLIWRNIIVRYKQTVVGIIWVLIQPIATMLVITLVFNVFLQVESGDETPYPIFVLSALIFWRYFSSSVTQGGQSLVGNAHMIGKVYFPRILIPIASCTSPIVDFLLSLVVLLVAMPFFGILPSLRILFIPILLAMMFITALSVSLWLSALNIRYRDVTHLIPFLIQIWMYLVPIIYPISTVPESIRSIYSLNPMVGVVEGARWILLDQQQPDASTMVLSMATVLILFVGGLLFFSRVERSFADIV